MSFILLEIVQQLCLVLNHFFWDIIFQKVIFTSIVLIVLLGDNNMKMILRANSIGKKILVTNREDNSLQFYVSRFSIWRYCSLKQNFGNLFSLSSSSEWVYTKCLCWNSTVTFSISGLEYRDQNTCCSERNKIMVWYLWILVWFASGLLASYIMRFCYWWTRDKNKFTGEDIRVCILLGFLAMFLSLVVFITCLATTFIYWSRPNWGSMSDREDCW